MLHIYRPRYIVLLQSNGHFCTLGVILWYVTHKQMSLPLLMSAILPTYTYGCETHVSSKLYYVLCGDKVIPMRAITVDSAVIMVADICRITHHDAVIALRCHHERRAYRI